MWKLIALAAAVGAFAAPATAADQIRIKGSDTGTFSLAPAGPQMPGIYLATDVSSGVASHLGHYNFLAHETYDANQNVVTQATFTISTKHGTLSGKYTATLGVGATPNIATYHAPGFITGGTRRYAGATGTIVFDGFGDFTTFALEDHFTATIVLPDDEDEEDD